MLANNWRLHAHVMSNKSIKKKRGIFREAGQRDVAFYG